MNDKLVKLKNLPPKVQIKTVPVEKDKCKLCDIKRKESEIISLKREIRDLDTENSCDKAILIIYSFLASLFSSVINPMLSVELSGIGNTLKKMLLWYQDKIFVCADYTIKIDTAILQKVSYYAVIIVLIALAFGVVIGTGCIIKKFIVPKIKQHTNILVKVVFMFSLAIVLFLGSELKGYLPSPLCKWNVFILWIIFLGIFFGIKSYIDDYRENH